MQSHGGMIVFPVHDPVINQVSESLAALTGLPVEGWLNRPVSQVVDPSHQALIFEWMIGAEEGRPLHLSHFKLVECGSRFEAILHRVGDLVILELEPDVDQDDHRSHSLFRKVSEGIQEISDLTSTDAMCEQCARLVKRVSGFDRVMIYKFSPEWNGRVIAEAREPDLEPFLGLNYPASDIPRQARELYTTNWLRFIANRDYTPSALIPQENPWTGQPLDMSGAVLRSVSPVHLQYLRNMGVGASMSISIVCNGRLWGLIACHHYSPHFVSYDVRNACELLGRTLSPLIVLREEQEVRVYLHSLAQARVDLRKAASEAGNIGLAVTQESPHLLNLLDADGAAVVSGGEVFRVGQTPSAQDIIEIAAHLYEQAVGQGFCATDNLPTLLKSHRLDPVASGALAIFLSDRADQAVMWFRVEQVRSVNWAGDPRKSVVESEQGNRLSPRGSFSLWMETVRGRSRPWLDSEIRGALEFRLDLRDILLERNLQLASEGISEMHLAREREQALLRERAARTEAERLVKMKEDFVAVLSHELRSPLTAILGWTQILRRRATGEIADGLAVIERSAKAQAQMVEDLLDVSRISSGKLRLDLEAVDLAVVVEQAIETAQFAADAKDIRIVRTIDPRASHNITGDPGRLQQIVWNLLSNAIKFTPAKGKVHVTVDKVDSHIELVVTDTGIGIDDEFLPHIFDRFRQADGSFARRQGGLGLGLGIVRNLVELHGGTVSASSHGKEQGSTFVVSLPVRSIRPPTGRPSVNMEPENEDDRGDCSDLNILVVDDEPHARDLVTTLLSECGASVVAVSSAKDAFETFFAEPEKFDVVVSDIGMPEEDGLSFIRRFRAEERARQLSPTPAIALTAYSRPEDRRQVLLAGFQLHLGKPVDALDLTAAVVNVAGRLS